MKMLPIVLMWIPASLHRIRIASAQERMFDEQYLKFFPETIMIDVNLYLLLFLRDREINDVLAEIHCGVSRCVPVASGSSSQIWSFSRSLSYASSSSFSQFFITFGDIYSNFPVHLIPVSRRFETTLASSGCRSR
jgi:hypothetical protein